MDKLLIAIALLIQTADGVYSCNRIQQGYVELNPIYGSTCKSIAVRKALIIPSAYLLLPNKLVSIGLITGGGLGLAISFNVKK